MGEVLLMGGDLLIIHHSLCTSQKDGKSGGFSATVDDRNQEEGAGCRCVPAYLQPLILWIPLITDALTRDHPLIHPASHPVTLSRAVLSSRSH